MRAFHARGDLVIKGAQTHCRLAVGKCAFEHKNMKMHLISVAFVVLYDADCIMRGNI